MDPVKPTHFRRDHTCGTAFFQHHSTQWLEIHHSRSSFRLLVNFPISDLSRTRGLSRENAAAAKVFTLNIRVKGLFCLEV